MNKEDQKFTKQGTVKALAGLLAIQIPVIGPLLQLYGDVLNNIENRRLNDLIDALKAKFQEWQGTISEDYLKREDFIETFNTTARRIVTERNDVKRQALKNMLLNTIQREETNFDTIDHFTGLINTLTQDHIKALHLIYRPVEFCIEFGLDEKMKFRNHHSIFWAALKWDKLRLEDVLFDLENIRLIVPSADSMYVSQSKTIPELVHIQTQKGKDFISYITQ